MQAGAVHALAEEDWIFPATASRPSGSCAVCRRRPSSPGGEAIPPAGGTPPIQRRFDLRPHRHAGAARRGACMGEEAPRGSGLRARLLRRRRHLGGRLSRGRQLRRRDAAPLVLFCNNNYWAISTPVTEQTAAERSPLRRRLRDARGARRRPRRPGRLRGDEGCGRAREGRRRADPHRGGLLPHRPHATADDPGAYIDPDRSRRSGRASASDATTATSSAAPASSPTRWRIDQ